MPLQIPPAVGSSGQFVETVIVTSSQQRHVMVIGDGASTAYAGVTSSGGLAIAITNPSTAVTVTNPSTAVNTLSSGPVLVLSSGPMTIAGTVTVLSASSGLVQISGTPLVNVVGTSSGVVPATTSGGLATNVTNPTTAVTVTNLVRSLSSGIVSPSSNWTVNISSGVIIMSSVQTVTATAATNPWSSAPGFNMPVVNASSGLVQISGTATIVSASSGLVQTLSSGAILLSSAGITQILLAGTSGGFGLVTSQGSLQVITTASASGSTSVNIVGSSNAQAPVTSSGGVGVTILGGVAIGGSTAVNIIGTSSAIGPVTTSGGQLVTAIASSNWTVVLSSIPSLSSGTVTLSSAPLVIVASSGGTIPVTLSTVFSLSSVPTVTATAATNPWSSAPGFNVPIVSASSGLVQLTSQITVTNVSASSGLVQLSSQITVATTGTLIVVSASSGFVQALMTTGAAGGVTSTYLVLTTVKGIKTAAGRLFGYSVYTSAALTGGAVLIFYNMTSANVVVGTSQTMVVPLPGLNSTAIAASAAPILPEWFGPNGLDFGTAISVASGVTATGAVVSTATPVYLTVFYT